MREIGAPRDNRAFRTDNMRRAVAPAPDRFSLVKFDYLAVIDIGTESLLASLDLLGERIRRELNAIRQSTGKIGYECHRCWEISFPHAVGNLCLGIKRDKGVLITNTPRIVARRHVALFPPDVCPNLIDLDMSARKIAHLLIHELRAAFTDFDQQLRPGHPLRAAD